MTVDECLFENNGNSGINEYGPAENTNILIQNSCFKNNYGNWSSDIVVGTQGEYEIRNCDFMGGSSALGYVGYVHTSPHPVVVGCTNTPESSWGFSESAPGWDFDYTNCSVPNSTSNFGSVKALFR